MKKINEKQLDRIRGALYGVAVGDALGGPLEFMSDRQIRDAYGRVTDMIGGGWLNLKRSTWPIQSGCFLLARTRRPGPKRWPFTLPRWPR